MPEEVLFEVERRQSRAAVATALRSIADKLDAGDPITFTVGDRSATVDPPDRPTFEVKVERETDRDGAAAEMSVEFELEWPTGETADTEGTPDAGGLSID